MGTLDIGLRQARLLCQMKQKERLDFIADGLPLLLASARGLWSASRELSDRPREANILEGHAEEEAAKILILLDIVRCPPKLTGSRIGPMVRWFYDHLARLLYAKAVTWKPMHVDQLREYVDSERKAHYVEGYAGEYIMPNWEIYSRESRLYVDIEAQEDGHRAWSIPQGYAGLGFFDDTPVLRITEALAALGVFTPGGVRAVADVWGQLNFVDKQGFSDSQRLTYELLERLDQEHLFTEAVEKKHAATLYDAWQLPMYHFDFTLVPVPMEDLQRERECLYYAEVGDIY